MLNRVISHIFGFDLNPLAVLSSRVNYLIAVADLISTHSEVEIPVYQADAVYAPAAHDDAGRHEPTWVYEIGTRKQAIHLELPEGLIQARTVFGRVLEILERVVSQGDSEKIFFATLHAEPEYMAAEARDIWEPYPRDVFFKIQQLEMLDWDRIWCRIVRSFFASVAVGKCQYVAGNPPWVRWSELPSAYAERIKPACESYRIFSEDKFFGGNELDISGMITYTVADKWLDADGGRLAFVLTQKHFQSQSSGGFRRFEVMGTPLRVLEVDDFVKVKPFAGLANPPAAGDRADTEYARGREEASSCVYR